MGTSHRLTTEQRENLIAYIDGELEQETMRDIEKTLADNPVATHEVDVLKKTWSMLDYLERPEASEKLIEQTLTSIQVYRTGEKFALPAWWNQAKQGMISVTSVAGILLAAYLGYVASAELIPSPANEIAKDLQVIEKYDELQEIGSLAYLNLIKKNNLVDEIKKSARDPKPPGFPR